MVFFQQQCCWQQGEHRTLIRCLPVLTSLLLQAVLCLFFWLCVTRLCFKSQEKNWSCEKMEFKNPNQNTVVLGRGFFIPDFYVADLV